MPARNTAAAARDAANSKIAVFCCSSVVSVRCVRRALRLRASGYRGSCERAHACARAARKWLASRAKHATRLRCSAGTDLMLNTARAGSCNVRLDECVRGKDKGEGEGDRTAL